MVLSNSKHEWSKSPDAVSTIAVIGGAFCGVTLAARLIRELSDRADVPPVRIVLIERGRQVGRGAAYSTQHPAHVLNVPAARMSAWPEEPEHFLRWVQKELPGVKPDSFVPRWLYGSYLHDVLDEAVGSAKNTVRFESIRDEAIDIENHASTGRAIIKLKKSQPVAADHVVLAMGNFAPVDPVLPDPAFLFDHAYIRNPWDADTNGFMKPDDDVLIIGSGLTMVDVALSLRAQGHQGTIHAVSRHGLLPRAHRAPSKPPAYHLSRSDIAGWPRSTLELLRQIRSDIRKARRNGDNWREVINALRHVTADLWNRLDAEEQRRFLRHVRPFWEIHRHRLAPSVNAAISRMISADRLRVVAGRMTSLERRGASITALIQPRGEKYSVQLNVACVINCAGPQCDLTKVDDELIANLLRRRTIQPDPLQLGIDCDQHGTVISPLAGGRDERFSALGSLRRGQFWESTAVPELREQVKAAAQRLVGAIESHSQSGMQIPKFRRVLT